MSIGCVEYWFWVINWKRWQILMFYLVLRTSKKCSHLCNQMSKWDVIWVKVLHFKWIEKWTSIFYWNIKIENSWRMIHSPLIVSHLSCSKMLSNFEIVLLCALRQLKPWLDKCTLSHHTIDERTGEHCIYHGNLQLSCLCVCILYWVQNTFSQCWREEGWRNGLVQVHLVL